MRLPLTILTAALACFAPAAEAVVVALDNTATHTQAPATDDFGFGNIAIVDNNIAGIPASGVYLGDGWILTAFHNVSDGGNGFAFGGINLAGVAYSVDASTATRLHNPDLSLADLAMFRLTAVPNGVPSVTLAGTTSILQTPVRMAGNGQDRALTETRWNTSWAVDPFGIHFGYQLVGTRALRWGTNTVETLPQLLFPPEPPPQFGNVIAFSTDFDRVSGEAQATGGDSGGGVFRKNGANWELAGIMITVGLVPGQPADKVVYGNRTFAADVATYKTEIELTMATVPEPSTALLLAAGSAMLLRRRRPAQG